MTHLGLAPSYAIGDGRLTFIIVFVIIVVAVLIWVKVKNLPEGGIKSLLAKNMFVSVETCRISSTSEVLQITGKDHIFLVLRSSDGLLLLDKSPSV